MGNVRRAAAVMSVLWIVGMCSVDMERYSEHVAADQTGEERSRQSLPHAGPAKRRGPKRGGEREEKSTPKAKRWKESVSKHDLKNASIAGLEQIVQLNRKVLEQLWTKHQADLKNRTQCRVGSIEWISDARDMLEAIEDDLKEGVQGGEEQQKEAGMIELLGDAIKGYNEELEDRREFLSSAVQSWIPQYIGALDQFLLHKESVVEMIRSGECTKKQEAEMKKRLDLHLFTYRMLKNLIEKGFEDLARGREIEDIRRNPYAVCKVDKTRGWRGVGGKKSYGQNPTYSINHIKNTFFCMPLSTFLYDCYNTWPPREDKARRAKESEKDKGRLFYFFRRQEDLEQRLFVLRSAIPACLESLCFQMRGRSDAEKARAELEEIREKVASRAEEIKTLKDVWEYVAAYYEKNGGREQVKPVLSMEAVESYVKREIESTTGDLERVLRVLYRVMRESGHEESVQRRKEEGVEEHCISKNHRYRMLKKWLTGLSSDVDGMERRMTSLAKKNKLFVWTQLSRRR